MNPRSLFERITQEIADISQLQPTPEQCKQDSEANIRRRNTMCAGAMKTALDELEQNPHITSRLLLEKIAAWSRHAGEIMFTPERPHLSFWDRRGIADGYERIALLVIEHLDELTQPEEILL